MNSALSAAAAIFLLSSDLHAYGGGRDYDHEEHGGRHHHGYAQQQYPPPAAESLAAPPPPPEVSPLIPPPGASLPQAETVPQAAPWTPPPGAVTAPLDTTPTPELLAHSSRTLSADKRKHRVHPPKKDENGQTILASALRRAPKHAIILGNAPLMDDIIALKGTESQPGRFYWHNDAGVRYCHYYDHWGAHWYGFYSGANYYWTLYEEGQWWWYDPVYSRWLYWNGNYWWWQNPGNILYSYDDANYNPYSVATAADQAALPAAQAAAVPPPQPRPTAEQAAPPVAPGTNSPPAATPGADAHSGDTFYSPEGSRMVQITGDRNESFLYSRYQGEEPEFMSFLGRDVAKVQFNAAKTEDQLQILLTFKDGTFWILDSHGRRFSAPSDAAPTNP